MCFIYYGVAIFLNNHLTGPLAQLVRAVCLTAIIELSAMH